ncbi:MAG: mannose-1-phosphate guanylyltransferase [Clostridia bacterium]|nr:mannose-1-phosphate guanylyltransferase [Clostridia bacterium]
MKCFVLAGGSGDRLWPLSRKNYPKQFMQFRDNRSMFQETIARNLPLCDEFFIITNEKYRYIAEGQLQAFQGIKYRLIFEEVSLKTAPAVLFSAMLCNPDDELLIVATDHIIEGGNYNDCILQAKEVLAQDKIAILGIPVKEAFEGYGYLRANAQGEVVDFKENATLKMAQRFYRMGGYFWDAGIILAKTGVLIQEFATLMRELYCKTMDMIREVDVDSKAIVLRYGMQIKLNPISFGDAIISKSKIVKLIPADFYWNKIIDIKSFYAYVGKKFDNRFISRNSKNISIINRANDKLVVVNGVKDLYVVNTDDALYITNEKDSSEIKSIVKENYEGNEYFFDDNKLLYQDWGIKEYLTKSEGYSIKKMTIYPGKTIPAHFHQDRSDHLTIVKGVATIQIKGKGEKEYPGDSGVLIPCGTIHQIANKTCEDVIIIESSVVKKKKECEEGVCYKNEGEKLIHLTPIFKDYLWGGTQIRDRFGKQCDTEPIAESWELSCHKAGQSIITNGKYAGLSFGAYLKEIGKEKLGWKCQPFDAFPLMIKFIDAKEALSIQVHPDDDYALSVEREYGKNELWYIVDCEPDSYLYIGFKKNVSEEEVRRRIEEKTLTEILNQVPVKKGETYFLNAGTVHAIGTGIFICEVQQSSNATYRLYDYGRKDKDGKERQLHIDKALDVLNRNKTKPTCVNNPVKKENGNCMQTIGDCKYFEVKKYTVKEKINLIVGAESFLSLIFFEGEGTVQAEQEILPFKAGDSFFVPAGVKSVQVIGSCEFITTRI